MNTYALQSYGKQYDIQLEKTAYVYKDLLAVEMWVVENGERTDPWSKLTVCLGVYTDPDCAFIDTNNNGEQICDWLVKNKIAEPTGRMQASGFCMYPEFRFNMSAFE